MMCNNPKLYLVNMNAYINLVVKCRLVLKILSRNEISALIKGHNSGTYLQKMTCYNPKLDLAKMNAYIKFSEILPIDSQDIEWKPII